MFPSLKIILSRPILILLLTTRTDTKHLATFLFTRLFISLPIALFWVDLFCLC